MRFINDVALKEIHLSGHPFMWSNERSHTTLERIDRTFVSNNWDNLFPNHEMHSLVLVLQPCTSPSLNGRILLWEKRLHFRSFWPKFDGFLEVVEKAWHCPCKGISPFQRLDWLLRNTT
jgi:hypothetical protein